MGCNCKKTTIKKPDGTPVEVTIQLPLTVEEIKAQEEKDKQEIKPEQNG